MTFQIELVSPESISYSGEAEMVVARTLDGGDIAFQPGHVPFIGVLAVWSVDVMVRGCPTSSSSKQNVHFKIILFFLIC